MREVLGERVFVITSEFSQPISMGEANAVLIDFTVFVLSGTVTVYVQESNDRENWDDVASTVATVIGAYELRAPSAGSGIASRYVRVKYVQSVAEGAMSILSVGLTTSSQ